MTPTLAGRIQTRLALLASLGFAWTLIFVPFLPRSGSTLASMYQMALLTLVLTMVVGTLFWEPLYHLGQQWRWEKDWPICYSLFFGIPEGIVMFWVVDWLVGPVGKAGFLLIFASTWIIVWIAANGPVRVVLIRWRYRGGRVWQS